MPSGLRSELEARLLASIGNLDQWRELIDAGLGKRDFPSFSPMYEYILDNVERQGRLPRLLDLKATFNLPASISRGEGEFRFVLREFQQISVARRVQEVLDLSVSKYGQDPTKLLSSILNDLMAIQSTTKRHVSVTDDTMLARLDRYEYLFKTKPENGPLGIPTGIGYFDNQVQLGWLPGELVGVVGRVYIGKSWLLLYFGLVAWRFGRRVVFVSPEMPVEETEARFDALLMASQDIRVETRDLYRGYKPTEKMRSLASSVGGEGRWITYSSGEGESLGLSELSRIVRQYSPNLLIVDGLPLLESRRSKYQQSWETIKELSYGLKNLSVSLGVSTLLSHQANRQAHNTARPPALHEVAFGDAFAQACDRVLSLSKPDKKEGKALRVTIQKFRRGEPLQGGVDFYFDPGRGKIYELHTGDRGGNGVENPDIPSWEGVDGELSLP